MKVKRIISFLVILAIMTSVAWGVNRGAGKWPGMPLSLLKDTDAHLWVNSIFCVVYNDGNFGYDNAGKYGKTDGLYFPFASPRDTKSVIYSAGIWIGAKVNNETRLAIAEYSSEFVPGPMKDSTYQTDAESFRIYKIGSGFELDANKRVVALDDSEDRALWPDEDGAPVDALGQPAILGSQMCWSVYNDASEEGHTNMATKTLGIEVQQSTFGFAAKGPLDNVIFLKYTLINKGKNTLDSTYISLWADPDVGDASDDLVGCDTVLSLGYCYNDTDDDIYGHVPPAVGFDFFQGPLIPSVGDTAYLPTGPVPDFKQLGMTSFNKYINGTDPQNATEAYNYMKGIDRDGSPIEDPGGTILNYQVPGDPVTGEGWVDEDAADRRYMMTTGPFTMAPGDTQVVVAAVVAAQGKDPLNAITELKRIDAAAQIVYDLNFTIPQPPPNPTVYARGFQKSVELVWLNDPEGPENYLEDFRTKTGELYIFEGYNVYIGDSPTGPWTKVATYDLDADQQQSMYESAVGEWADCVWDSLSEAWDCTNAQVPRVWDWAVLYEDRAGERIISQVGTNSGSNYQIFFDVDPRDGSPFDPYTPYYFAVSSYGVNIQQVYQTDSVFFGINFQGMLAYNLEAKLSPITVLPWGSSATLAQLGNHIEPVDDKFKSDGIVEVEYLVQDSVLGNDYKVTFNEDGTWDLLNETSGQLVLDDYGDQSDNFTYPIVNGVMVRALGPNPGFKTRLDALDSNSELGFHSGSAAYMGGRNVRTNGNYSNFVLKFLADPGDTVQGPLVSGNQTIRYLDDESDTIWGYFYSDPGTGEFNSRAYQDLCKVSIPFALYDVGRDLTSKDDDVRLWPLMYDFYGDYRWYNDDYFMFLTKDIGGTTANIYGNDFFSFAPHDGDAAYYGFNTADPASRRDWDYRSIAFTPDGAYEGWVKGDSAVYITNKANTPQDVFTFRTKKLGQGDGSEVVKTMANIKTVPNPYYNYSTYELDQFHRVIKFINLPGGPEIKIRIFNIAGDHIRTLVHNAGNVSSELEWDVKTENGLYVASGIYIYLAESDLGQKVGKMAVFTEVEQLNNY
jgi:hypothetical protein